MKRSKKEEKKVFKKHEESSTSSSEDGVILPETPLSVTCKIKDTNTYEFLESLSEDEVIVSEIYYQ